ncbi:hypothetical protein [Bradyrhizobium icense]|uniref:Uncharacterized protein n=1 Tax=Bradyrhizobium icense TaxID=1274631 RepID=A0A1B1UD40_9BRAD|nr:hypothetical protein [Bradyrhizobium icense]ANW00651.1 hypothetical protein LMTR13_11230 [Bradyrhizobium icense]
MKADLVAKRVVIEVAFDMVTIQLHCGDEYAAQVLHEDICDRLRSGKPVSLSMALPSQRRADD